jgi:hypothetical protein
MTPNWHPAGKGKSAHTEYFNEFIEPNCAGSKLPKQISGTAFAFCTASKIL